MNNVEKARNAALKDITAEYGKLKSNTDGWRVGRAHLMSKKIRKLNKLLNC